MFLAGILTADGVSVIRARPVRPGCARAGQRVSEYVLVDAGRSATGAAIVITQNDVRAIQLARARCMPGRAC